MLPAGARLALQVNKLRELLLEKGNEISLLSSKYLEQVRTPGRHPRAPCPAPWRRPAAALSLAEADP